MRTLFIENETCMEVYEVETIKGQNYSDIQDLSHIDELGYRENIMFAMLPPEAIMI